MKILLSQKLAWIHPLFIPQYLRNSLLLVEKTYNQQKLTPVLEASKSSGPTTVLPQTEEHAAIKASTSSDESQDSEPGQAIQPRRSLRSTKGAPPTRFGYAISHKLVCPYFQFMKNGKIQLSSKL